MYKKQKQTKALKLIIIFFIFVFVAFSSSLSFSRPIIKGIVQEAPQNTALENIQVRIENSGFKAKTDQKGKFKLPFAPGNFTVIFEGAGFIPKAVQLSLSSDSDYPMGEVKLYPFPTIVDMYKEPVGGVNITVRQSAYNSKGALLYESKTNSTGLWLVQYFDGRLEVTAEKKGYKKRTLTFIPDRPQKLLNYKWLLPPENPGIYHQGKYLEKDDFKFIKKQVEGLAIPAYYDGIYKIEGKPEILTSQGTLTLYFVAEHSRTLGENPFASKGGTFIYKVKPNDIFVVYDDGISEGEKINTYKISTVQNEVEDSLGGLVQQKLKIYKIDLKCPAGEYVLFQGGGNSMDKEPHPEKELGCWHFKVIRE